MRRVVSLFVIDDNKSLKLFTGENYNILKSLVTKNIRGRYKSSTLGFLWHFFTPCMMMIVYYVVFTEIRQSAIPNFWIYLSSALFPFTFMVSNLTSGAGCIVGNAGLVKKIYFPRILIILAQTVSTLIVALIGYSIVLLVLFFTGHSVELYLVLISIVVFCIMWFFTTGYTMLLSTVTVYCRDIQHFINSISMVFFFITPMYFIPSSVGGLLRTVVLYNPFAYFVEVFHSLLYYNSFPDLSLLLVCVMLSVFSFVVGLVIFEKYEPGFPERL